MKFGIYLLDQGLISTEQLVEAIRHQVRLRVSLGKLAMQSGDLNKVHVLHILSVQSKQPKLFGQIALELGYLDADQLARLLLRQDELLKPISETLVELGAITRDRMEAALKEYRQQMADDMDPSGVLRTVV